MRIFLTIALSVCAFAQLPKPGGSSGPSGGSTSVSGTSGVTCVGTVCSIDNSVVPFHSDFQSGAYNTISDVGGDDDYSGALPYALASYTPGMRLYLKAATTNTGAATIDAGPGVKTIVNASGSTLANGEINVGGINTLLYDGTNFRLAGSVVTDSRWNTYFAAGSVVGTADNTPGAGWYYPYQVAQALNGSAGGFRAILMRHTTSDYAEYRFKLPDTWTGTIGFKAFWTLRTDNSGAGTGRHDYDMACVSPGVDTINSALSYSTATQVSFNFTGVTYNTGQVDTVTLTLGTGCSAGDIASIRMTRIINGTSIDNTSLLYFSIQTPSTL